MTGASDDKTLFATEGAGSKEVAGTGFAAHFHLASRTVFGWAEMIEMVLRPRSATRTELLARKHQAEAGRTGHRRQPRSAMRALGGVA